MLWLGNTAYKGLYQAWILSTNKSSWFSMLVLCPDRVQRGSKWHFLSHTLELESSNQMVECVIIVEWHKQLYLVTEKLILAAPRDLVAFSNYIYMLCSSIYIYRSSSKTQVLDSPYLLSAFSECLRRMSTAQVFSTIRILLFIFEISNDVFVACGLKCPKFIVCSTSQYMQLHVHNN